MHLVSESGAHAHFIAIMSIFFATQLQYPVIPYLFMLTGDQGHSISPVTPSELLIALHNIDCANDETLMKAVIKGVCV